MAQGAAGCLAGQPAARSAEKNSQWPASWLVRGPPANWLASQLASQPREARRKIESVQPAGWLAGGLLAGWLGGKPRLSGGTHFFFKKDLFAAAARSAQKILEWPAGWVAREATGHLAS